MPRIVLADDHALFRDAIRALLTDEDDLEVVGEALDVAELFDRVRTLRPDLVVMDFSTLGASLIEIIRRLHELDPAVRILVLTNHPEDRFAVRCLQGGAAGYLTKDRPARDLLAAVRHTAGGRRYVSGPLGERLATGLARGAPGDAPHEHLSPRELQVLQGLGRALTVSQIARELGLSVKTVSTYRARAIEKLGVRNNAQAMLYAISHGLVEPF